MPDLENDPAIGRAAVDLLHPIKGVTMNTDPYNLNRFISAQEGVFENVINELSNGRKQTHWMWFIFPQIDGLGFSSTTKYYAIKSGEETRHYLNHPVLGARLQQCAGLVLAVEGKSAHEIFGSPDDMKLKSSMTLFAWAGGPGSVFARVLEKYFHGQQDERTIALLASHPLK
jgi:uncharacterized protein (DUF1810 family)